MPDSAQTSVVLTVNGTQYGGWTEVEIRRGIEQISGTFTLGVTERWADRSEPWPIKHGDACTVSIDGEVLITGYVDDLLPFFDSQQHAVTVVGRDKTGDLVDCSAIAKTGAWAGRNLLQIATDLCRPFGITVTADTDYGQAFKSQALQEGETVFEALDRLARMRGVLLVSDGRGGLVITRSGSDRFPTTLTQGENILSGRGTFSMRDRFQAYICKGQNFGNDFSTPDQNSGPKGNAGDTKVPRYRPLIIVAEDISDSKGLTDRAVWEAAVRMGRSARPEITVQGWRHADGLWLPNTLVGVKCPYLLQSEQLIEMLIVSTTYLLDDKGSRTVIELCRPEGFKLLAVPETDDGSTVW